MAKYVIDDTTLTGIADPIRVLSGGSEQLSPAAMGAAVTDANAEVSAQTDLLAQIKAALEAKQEG